VNILDFGFNDAADYPVMNAMLGVVITTVPASGSLRLNNKAVAAGQLISVIEIMVGGLVYTPPPDTIGYPVGSFTFQVEDDGGLVTAASTLIRSRGRLLL
jgi:hypothetical protein